MDTEALLPHLPTVYNFIVRHWPFWVYASIFAFIGEVSKNQVFTADNKAVWQREADKMWNAKKGWRILSFLLLCVIRTPVAFHPLFAGVILGLIPGIPMSQGVAYGAPTVLYCVGAGMLSHSLYDIVHACIKFVWKYILRKDEPAPEIALPGETS